MLLRDAIPDLEQHALVGATDSLDDSSDPETLGSTTTHLYLIQSTEVLGKRAFTFGRWRLEKTSISLTEWLESAQGAEWRHREWTVRTRTRDLTIGTEEPVSPRDPEPPERLMRELLQRSR